MIGTQRLSACLLGVLMACGTNVQAEEYPAGVGGSPADSAAGYVVITAPEADVLTDPRSGAPSLMKVVKGDLLPLKGQLGEWYSVAAGETAGWVRRESAALMFYPEFLDPERLRESYTPAPFVPHVPPGYWGYPGYYGYPGYFGYPGYRGSRGPWGGGIIPYPWGDWLGWGVWLHEGIRHDDHRDDHRGRDDGRYRNRPGDHR